MTGRGIAAARQVVTDNAPWLLIATAALLLTTTTLSLVPIGIMAALGLWQVAKGPRAICREPACRGLALLFLCLWLPQLVSLIDAVNFPRSAKTALSYPAYLFCGIFIVRALAQPGQFARLSLALLCLVAFWCVDAFAQYATGANLFGYPYQEGGLTGMFHPKIRLGLVVAVLAPIVLEALRRLNKDSPFSWLIMVPLIAVVFLSGRRSAWVILALSLLAYLSPVFLTLSTRAKCALLAAVCAASTLAIYTGLKDPGLNQRMMVLLTGALSSRHQAEMATSGRASLWDTAYNMFAENRINGVGPRGFRYVYEEHADEGDVFTQEGRFGHFPHLVFLEIAVETGLIGIAGFVLFYLTLLRHWWRDRRDLNAVAWRAALLAAAFPFNAHLAFYGSYWGGFLWLLIACAVAATSSTGPPARPGAAPQA